MAIADLETDRTPRILPRAVESSLTGPMVRTQPLKKVQFCSGRQGLPSVVIGSSLVHSVSSAQMSAQILIVDGHSIIFAWPELRALHDSKTAPAREKLTRILTEYQDVSGTHVVLVFDGRGPMITEESEPGGIQVFYSNTGRTADDVIERLVAKYGMLYSITVATSDLLEQQTAIAFGGNCISADGLRKLVTAARSDFNRELKRRNTR
jgi:predicted RNA-binding protein with PIN domain